MLLKDILATHDAAILECPFENPALRSPGPAEDCPKCGASASQHCGVKVGAAVDVVSALRQHVTQPDRPPSQDLDEVLGALTFYADPENYKSPSTGFVAQYDPAPSPARVDGGMRARRALGLGGAR